MGRFIKRVILYLKVISILIFILFEELIWESIAIPLYRYIDSLKFLEKLESFILEHLNRYTILILFLTIFIVVEIAGVLAGILIVSGYPLLGFVIYLTKIPIATFTFWLFKVSKGKLLSFGWFNTLYNNLISFIKRIKSSEIYQNILRVWYSLKTIIKRIKSSNSEDKEPSSIRGLRRLYKIFKKNR